MQTTKSTTAKLADAFGIASELADALKPPKRGFVWHNVPQREQEWYNLRLGIPTASNFHKLITPATLKPSAQRTKYRNQLLCEWITGVPMDDFTSKSMEAGIENEDRARNAYETLVDVETKAPGFFTTYDGMAGASPDALIDPDTDVEIKCRELHTQIGWALMRDEADERLEHRIQCQGRLMIEEREWSHLWNYNDRLVIPVLKFPRDEKVIGAIDAALRQFIDELLTAREKLTREYGPFERVDPAPAPSAPVGDFDLTDADVSAIYATSQERK